MIRLAFDKHKSIFIPFTMSGHPTLDDSTKAILALAEAGADIIQLGVPFSDPMADGPTNQNASEIALNNGVNVSKVIEQVKEIRKLGCTVPIMLVSYLNPIFSFGYERFCHDATEAGIDGLLIMDLPPEEGEDFYAMARKMGLEIVLMVSPDTDPARLSLHMSCKPSFIYYIATPSVTEFSKNLEEEIIALRKNLPSMKIVVGFGISSVEHVKSISRIADGLVIGTKLVSTLGTSGLTAFKNLAKDFADAAHEYK